MKTRIFQRPPTIARSTSWSKTVEPPTSASGPAAARMRETIRRAGIDSGCAAMRASTSQSDPSRLAAGRVTETTPRTRASRRATAAGPAGTITCTGAANPGPASAIARSVAARTSAFRGSSLSPRLNVVIARSGTRAGASRRCPRAGTATAAASRAPPTPSRRARPTRRPCSRAGARSRSTRAPASASSAGRSVSAASTETQTTTIAPTASERIPLTPIANSPASEAATVAPLNATAFPEVASARASAARGSVPSRELAPVAADDEERVVDGDADPDHRGHVRDVDRQVRPAGEPVDRRAREEDGGEAERERRGGRDDRPEGGEEDQEDQGEAEQLPARELPLETSWKFDQIAGSPSTRVCMCGV